MSRIKEESLFQSQWDSAHPVAVSQPVYGPDTDWSTVPLSELLAMGNAGQDIMQALQQGVGYGSGAITQAPDQATGLGTQPYYVDAALQQGVAAGQENFGAWDQQASGGGGGGGDINAPPGETDLSGGGTPSNAWQETYTLQNAPSWWRGMTALEQNAETEYISMMNNMLPFLSPEDQRTVASSLYQMLPEYFGSYDPNTWEKTTPAEYEIDPETGEPKLDENGKPIVKTPEQVDLNPWARAEQPVPTLLMQEYQTTKAAEQQMAALMNMAKSMGISDPNTMMGPGFRYLQQIAGAMKSFGAAPNPEEGWTRARKEQYMNTIDPLLASTGGTNNPLAAYSTLAKMMTQPYFSNAEQQLMPTTDANGNITWESNPQWWR